MFENNPDRREIDRLANRLWGFPKTSYEALEEVRNVLAMSQDEMILFLAILRKSTGSTIMFDTGNTRISFSKMEPCQDEEDSIDLIIEMRRKNVTNSAEYNLNEYVATKFPIVKGE